MPAPTLESKSIHLWTVRLAAPGEALAQHRARLDTEERARADRFLVPKASQRFIVARSTLRRLLGMYLDADEQTLSFGYGPHGKPYLIGESDLRFNLSHAAEIAIIAIARNRHVGVDIESTSRESDIDGVARKAFSDYENARLAALAANERKAAFFHVWTRKEAYVKARGEGFGYPTQSFSVSHRPRVEDALRIDDLDASARMNWRIAEIEAPSGYCAAVAASGRDWSVLTLDWGLAGGDA